MPARRRSAPRPRPSARAAVIALLLSVFSPVHRTAAAQLIQIKTLPIADGDQWRIFPSANAGMANVSIALRDSLLDPFVNPAKASRLSPSGSGLFFGSPTFYSISKNAGGAQTLPLGAVGRIGSLFGGIAVALQQIDESQSARQQFFPPTLLAADGSTVPQTTPSRRNRYAFASVGRAFTKSNVAIAGSVLWSGLNNVDGVDLLYAGSAGIRQHGGDIDARLGVTKEWSAGRGRGVRTLEALLLHDRFDMTHDVTWADQVWNPNTGNFASLARVDHNLDRTKTWGLHLAYDQPLADSGWRVGAIATANLASHPKLPDYQISQVMVIPWDPGHSGAYDLGLGLSKVLGPTTFGVDAIYEPIVTHTWGEAHGATQTQSGSTIPEGGKTTENYFHFSNAILRAGVGHELELGKEQRLRLDLGMSMRSISYKLDQFDHVSEEARQQDESWLEWTRTWGLRLHFSDLELRYTGRHSTGTGRPGILGDQRFVFAAEDRTGANILAAPSGPLTLSGVAVTTHQVSVSLPIR
jgi:hypothetical protein